MTTVDANKFPIYYPPPTPPPPPGTVWSHHYSCMADARAEIISLIAERDALEQRIAVSSERLRARGVGQHTPLVDREARTHALSVCRESR